MGVHSRWCRAASGALLASVVLAVSAPPVQAEAAAAFRPPVKGPVVDPWRPPVARFGPGNRGIDYRTEPGEEVRAAADGEVTFAGQVGGELHVVVLHPGGIRTSYSYLASANVRRGARVVQGEVVGTAVGRLHFGARVGDDYVDPSALLAGHATYRLVPVETKRPFPLAEEVRGLLAGLGRAGADAVTWAREVPGELVAEAVGLVRDEVLAIWEAIELLASYPTVLDRAGRYFTGLRRFRDGQEGCTPVAAPVPLRLSGRRIVVLVAGLGSSDDDGAIQELDTGELGYADADVVVFSYAGGQVGGTRSVSGVPTSSYDRSHSTGDLRDAATRLRNLLEAVRHAHPGVPVDVVAHSQGGLVARGALGADADHFDPRLPAIGHLVTLGTPHHGATLATAAGVVGTSDTGTLLGAGLRWLAGGAVDPDAEAVGQLAEASELIGDLDRRRLPPGATVTAIAAEGDLVVPALPNAVSGATNVVVPLSGTSAHDALPGDPRVQREVALALAGAGPTCRGLGGLATSAAIDLVEGTVGLALGLAGHWLDARAGGQGRRGASPVSQR